MLKPIIRTCPTCNEDYEVVKHASGRQIYCSRECWYKYFYGHKAGERKERKNPEWICQFCKNRNQLPYSLKNSMENRMKFEKEMCLTCKRRRNEPST